MCFILMLKFPVCNNLAKFNRVPRSVQKFGPSNSINIQKTQKYMPSGESGWGPFSIGTFTASRFSLQVGSDKRARQRCVWQLDFARLLGKFGSRTHGFCARYTPARNVRLILQSEALRPTRAESWIYVVPNRPLKLKPTTSTIKNCLQLRNLQLGSNVSRQYLE